MVYSIFRSDGITLPLTTKRGGLISVPNRSGLNWGQRPGRNEDQAYIPVPAYIQKLEFFPENGKQFFVEWDDGAQFEFVRAQFNGKAIQTPKDNAILGRYFRKRLGVDFGDPILLSHLLNYGRLDVDFYKENEKKFLADFSV